MKQSSRIEKDDMRACFIQGGQEGFSEEVTGELRPG